MRTQDFSGTKRHETLPFWKKSFIIYHCMLLFVSRAFASFVENRLVAEMEVFNAWNLTLSWHTKRLRWSLVTLVVVHQLCHDSLQIFSMSDSLFSVTNGRQWQWPKAAAASWHWDDTEVQLFQPLVMFNSCVRWGYWWPLFQWVRLIERETSSALVIFFLTVFF